MYFPVVKTPSEPITVTVQRLPASRMAIGLARAKDNGVILHGRQINAQTRGRVGGEQTGGSYIEIPPRTLKADIPLTFAIYVSADDVVIFGFSQGKQDDFEFKPHSEHIEFQEGNTPTLAIGKDLVSGSANAVVNYDDPDKHYT